MAKDDTLNDTFFPLLQDILKQLHRRDIAYVDLNKAENIIVGDDGNPYLVDFQISFTLPRWWPGNSLPMRVLLHILQRSDEYHLMKHFVRIRPDLLPPEQRDIKQLRPWWIRGWRMNRMNWRNWEHLTPILRIANFWDSDQNGGWVASRYVEEFQMLYVQSGVGEVQIGKQTHPLLPGDLIFYGPGEQHAFGPTTDETLRLVGLAFVFLQEDLSRLTSGRHASPERFKSPKGKPRCPLKPRPPARVSSQPGAGISQLCELLVTTQMSSKDDAAMR